MKSKLETPSSLYTAKFWRVGLFFARHLPPKISELLSRFVANVYWRFATERRAVVVENLLPVLNGSRVEAQKKARELFQNFSQKLVDLWRYESGIAIENLFGEWTGWEHFLAAQNTKKGILLLTPHLGNWEFGAPVLAKKGVKLLVITLAEPDDRLTEMRQASRARWGIETLVIGQDPFAFVEIIRRLDAGECIALLMDRPPERSSVEVKLFGKKFAASVAAAELARASGCILLPVYLPRNKESYAAHILPAVSYDRAALRSVEERQKLTQNILSAFEPAIRQYLNQWYHFIPIWR
ncbi:MAG: hypothetical protein M3Y82_09555 [Verrucomicrobiota bacterium]|nr:hypothetical protein [Verrucomicrobiota bacterium]